MHVDYLTGSIGTIHTHGQGLLGLSKINTGSCSPNLQTLYFTDVVIAGSKGDVVLFWNERDTAVSLLQSLSTASNGGSASF
jgi:hypothetical protein